MTRALSSYPALPWYSGLNLLFWTPEAAILSVGLGTSGRVRYLGKREDLLGFNQFWRNEPQECPREKGIRACPFEPLGRLELLQLQNKYRAQFKDLETTHEASAEKPPTIHHSDHRSVERYGFCSLSPIFQDNKAI